MGRIADALKRAEMEREAARGGEAESAAAAVATIEAPTEVEAGSENAASEEPAASRKPSLDVVTGLHESLIPFFQRSSSVTEQYRSLRTRLLSQNPQYEHRVLAITSAIPREGKSVTTLNLSCTIAEIRHLRVLAVDADFRRGSLARMLKVKEGPGLAEVLSGKVNYSDAIQPTPIPNLMFMPAGRTHGRPAAEILASAATRPIFKRIQNEFHYTIVDTPPATTVTDVGIIGQVCNGVVLVVRLHRTDEAAAKRAVRLLQSNNISIVGCLVVGRDRPGGRYGYGYPYYRYYRYDYREKETSRSSR
ncbi:MAG: CpsD/CapB family tyrosine-protein kinase [Phycisphaerae bacterium]|nr:CpsD/CapB family tyrosine-protein kinase [Phycisphaerae bacterium]